MKSKWMTVWTLIMSTTLHAAIASADESVMDVVRQREIRAAMIQSLQDRIAKHSGMSDDEVRADVAAELEAKKNTTAFKELAPEQAAEYASTVRDMDKDQIVALEQAQLQEMMSSDNYIFAFTNWVQHNIVQSARPFIILITIPVDIAMLPLTLIATIATGGASRY